MTPELLGRDDEIRELEILIGNGRNGRGGAALLLGEPGIGKTMLLDATLLLAGRETPALTGQAAGIATRRLAGLAPEAALRLLIRSLAEEIDPAVAVQVVTATGGNLADRLGLS
ncbi:DNA repair ATPase RecN [Actinoplanes tereljensis]|uniref:Orc1-like AAA ATPase domain-containing protein n=1 Tax=Paractinoplanes tereljensis TaxID=571912 RepID=A0A919NQ01_9ACTN|nr:AAA family ATPase [Actinoplanes tereljensis]GIF21522.1 hypothetical protein Ate02nite_42520 [Actinoplanes tereljensis]